MLGAAANNAGMLSSGNLHAADTSQQMPLPAANDAEFPVPARPPTATGALGPATSASSFGSAATAAAASASSLSSSAPATTTATTSTSTYGPTRSGGLGEAGSGGLSLSTSSSGLVGAGGAGAGATGDAGAVVLVVEVREARGLPVMDLLTSSADAFVEVRFGGSWKRETSAVKSLEPVWKEKFELNVPKARNLRTVPLEFRAWDKDRLSANDVIGAVYLDLSALLFPTSPQQLSAWFPLYDSLRGVQGELKLKISLKTPLDKDKVLFFSCSIPENVRIVTLNGLVDELLVEDDPENKWVDNFRKSRSSNDARQALLTSHTGRVRQHIAKKVEALNCNAVLCYRQHLDLEGDYIAARGYGTAARIELVETLPSISLSQSRSPPSPSCPVHQRATVSSVSILTMTTFAPNTIQCFGGVVAARLVKLGRKEKLTGARDGWWDEAREEIRNNAASLMCSHVVGYTESMTIQEGGDVCILSAQGTAVVLNTFGVGCSELPALPCTICHVPYEKLLPDKTPLPGAFSMCALCTSQHVPEILLSTTDLPPNSPCCGAPKHCEAKVCRIKKKTSGEANAIQISEILPFIEDELHRQIILKVKLQGMNALFGYRISISINETMIAGIASGTAVFLLPLSPPQFLRFAGGMTPPRQQIEATSTENVNNSLVLRKEYVKHHREIHQLPPIDTHQERQDTGHAKREKRKKKKKEFSLDATETNSRDRGHGTGLEVVTEKISSEHTRSRSTKEPRDREKSEKERGDQSDRTPKLSKRNLEDSITEVSGTQPLSPMGSNSPPPPISATSSFTKMSTDKPEVEPHKKKKKKRPPTSSSAATTTEEVNPEGVLRRSAEVESTKVPAQEDSTTLESGHSKLEIDEDFDELLLEQYRCLGVSLSTLDSQFCWKHHKCSTYFFAMIKRVKIRDTAEPTKQFHESLKSIYSTLILHLGFLWPKGCLCRLSSDLKLVSENQLEISITGTAVGKFHTAMCASSRDVTFTPASHIPGRTIAKYLGYLNVHLVRETFSLDHACTLGDFTQLFLHELFSVVRAQCRARGANTLLDYCLDICTIKSEKDEAYCLFSISGDTALCESV
ncbi:hypothetical protein Pelo_13131 [Pelomyxa schiedti]|nr:hypothetical protein Pelo_13131 [Pelomyxa schiedti]